MLFLLPSKNPHPGVSVFQLLKRIDWIGAVLVTSSLALFTLAISFGGNEFAWNSGVVIGFFLASGVLAILFGLSQTILPSNTKEKRLFPVHYFLRKDMVLLSVASGAGACTMFAAVYYIPLFFQFTRGDTAIKAAVRILPIIVCSVTTTVISGVAMSITGYYTPWYLVGGSLVIIGYSLLNTITSTTSDIAIYCYLILIGAGTGGFAQIGFATAQAISPKTETEAAISFIMQGQLLGVVIGLTIAGSLFITHSIEGLSALIPNIPVATVKGAIAGSDTKLLSALPPDVQQKVIDIIVQSIDRVYILGIVGGVVAVLCGILLTQRRLDMKNGAAGIS